MSTIFNIDHGRAHCALDDAMATAKLLLKYLEIFICKDINKVIHLYYPRNRYELDRIHYTKKYGEETVFEKINSLKSSALVTLKGEKGKILFSFPCTIKGKERELLQEKLRHCNWRTTSLRLHGTLIEALTHLHDLFKKIGPEVRLEIVKNLWNSYLPDCKMPSPEEQKIVHPAGDFVITHHLVPEQMVILPIHSFQRKNRLVFRYPGHKKKLLQYIKSKRRSTKTSCEPLLGTFMAHYLAKVKQKKGEFFIFKRSLASSNPKRFLHSLDKFLMKNPNPYNYPHHYI